jgi:hypothetical protein
MTCPLEAVLIFAGSRRFRLAGADAVVDAISEVAISSFIPLLEVGTSELGNSRFRFRDEMLEDRWDLTSSST